MMLQEVVTIHFRKINCAIISLFVFAKDQDGASLLKEGVVNGNDWPILRLHWPTKNPKFCFTLSDWSVGLCRCKPEEFPHVWNHFRTLLERCCVVVSIKRNKGRIRRKRSGVLAHQMIVG
jgi:hypothetical protein